MALSKNVNLDQSAEGKNVVDKLEDEGSGDLSPEDLDTYFQHMEEMEMLQVNSLQAHCNSPFQFAKTHSTLLIDWEKTKNKLLEQLKTGNLPPDTTPEFHEQFIKKSDELMQKKFNSIREGFYEKFGESIYNYLGEDGKTKGLLKSIFGK